MREELRRAPACVIVKHANPCGVAIGKDPRPRPTAKAFKTDPTSAFGGIIAFNRPVDGARPRKPLVKQFVEVLMAPGYTPEALEVFQATKAKLNVRVLEIALPQGRRRPTGTTAATRWT